MEAAHNSLPVVGAEPQARDVFSAANSARAENADRIVEQYAQAYVRTRQWNAAYRSLHDCTNMKPSTVNKNASALAEYPGVRERVRQLLDEAAQRTVCTVAQVLARNFEIATADPAAIVRTKRYACRHCWGFNGDYQWRTEDEHAEACARELDEAARQHRVPKLPSAVGGFGYSVHRDPNPDCEHCAGVGEALVYIEDTDKLTGSARLLYKGVKQDRFGAITVELHDQQAALREVARILGAYKDSLAVTPPKPPAELPADLPRERIADAYLTMIGAR